MGELIGRVVIFCALGVVASGCGLNKSGPEPLPYELSREECDNLIEIRSEGLSLEEVEGPSESQQAKDALNPGGADLASYQLVYAVEQSFENLLERRVVIEEAGGTISDPQATTSYEATYDLEQPIELEPHATAFMTFEIVVPADRLSTSYTLDLLEGTALGMTIAPNVRVTVPESDNCGYPEGMVVQAKSGTVEVRRPVEDTIILGILSGVLKAAAHGGKL
jgi:hypothetical protein